MNVLCIIEAIALFGFEMVIAYIGVEMFITISDGLKARKEAKSDGNI